MSIFLDIVQPARCQMADILQHNTRTYTYTHTDVTDILDKNTAHRVIISESEFRRGQYTAVVFNAHITFPSSNNVRKLLMSEVF